MLQSPGEGRRGDGQREADLCAVWIDGFRPDPAAMRLHNALADSQAQAGAAVLARARFLAAIEALEDVRQVGRRDALARVPHLDTHGGPPAVDRNLHTTSPGRVTP